ncbi:TVP38/TMEM64 family protein [Caenispirillum bisanense]|uniref:TVP38/TMEM64 family protein n=1 Tax=Caenispirillum bisanense TaxID=414052 RepID=UPI0031E4400B
MTATSDEFDDDDGTDAAAAPGAASGLRSLLKGLAMIAGLVAIGYAAREVGVVEMLDPAWLDTQVRGRGFWGELVFVAAGALLTGVGLPRQMVAFGGGYAFGLWEGVVWALLAQSIGCAGAFWYARLFGRAFVRHRFGPRIARVDAFLRGNPFSMTLLIRFLPVGSNVITNLAAGVTSVGARPFLAGSALGYLPQTVIFALLGSGIHVDPELRITLSVVLFVISGVLGVWLWRRIRRDRKRARLAAASAAAAEGSDGAAGQG